jgi:hypothetical protein
MIKIKNPRIGLIAYEYHKVAYVNKTFEIIK